MNDDYIKQISSNYQYNGFSINVAEIRRDVKEIRASNYSKIRWIDSGHLEETHTNFKTTYKETYTEIIDNITKEDLK